MKIDILTLFPKMFSGPFEESIIKRAREKGLVEIAIHNLRDWAEDRHKTVDDKPYGGGAGMVLRVDIIDKAITQLKKQKSKGKSTIKKLKFTTHVVLLSPQGQTFNQQTARRLAKLDHLILIAGHYEGFDGRIRDYLIDEEVSIGDYVLTGGELPAMVVTDSLVRLIPEVLGDKNSLKDETHSKPGKVKYPVYTRPETYKNWDVPKILLSGNHAEVEKWRREKQKQKEK